MSVAIEKRAVELLWKQWTAVGVAGVAPPPAQAVDLEALIAFTPFVASVDPRLAEESSDWCARIGKRFISISRLRKIVRLMPSRPVQGGIDLPSMLVDKIDTQTSMFSEKSRAPALAHPSLLQLRSRYIFGVGARADILSILVMQGHIEGGQRASALRPTGYSKQAVSTVLDELAHAGVLSKLARSAAVSYELVKEVGLHSLLSPLPTRMPKWAERFTIIANILNAWRQYGTRASYAIELAKVLDGIRHVAAAVGKRPPTTGRPPELLGRIERWALALLQDDSWEHTWLFEHEDISDEIQAAFRDDLIQAVHEGDYPVGYTELSDFACRIIDAENGTAECHASFTAQHPREDFTFDGHVEGKFSFDPDTSDKDEFLASLELSDVRSHFDMGDPDED